MKTSNQRRNRKHHPVILVVLDGFGMSIAYQGNAITTAKTPSFSFLWENYPRTILAASGEAVGLPHGLAGNSEVGHLNMGAGRIVKQELTKINEAIKNKSFFQNPVLLSAIKWAKASKTNLHLMGLLSDGGVHADYRHLFALLKLIKNSGLKKNVFIHAFTDGRDVAPRSAEKYFHELEARIEEIGLGKVASLVGRGYAMDRAHNWERVKIVYEMMTEGKARHAKDPIEALQKDYGQGLSDQFIEPTIIAKNHEFPGKLRDNDAIIFFNLRSDRSRQLSKPFVLKDFKIFKRKITLNNLFFVGLTNFGDDLPMSVAFPEFPISNTLPSVLGRQYGLKQFYIAEEEKFAHVTYFFHGGSSLAVPNEKRIMIDSVDIKNYASLPEMSSKKVTETLLKQLKKKEDDFYMVNFANSDMVAHTGDFKATVKAIEIVDRYLGEIYAEVKKQNGTLIVTADHGNAEGMIDPETNAIVTRHTNSPVPFIIMNHLGKRVLREGVLGNVAPTILDLLEIEKPREMTEESLLE